MKLSILKAGVLDTVQDLGRYGFMQYGVNPGGAMDKNAMRLANALAGNEWTEAVIEMHYPASTFIFHEPALIAIAGADFGPAVNGEPVANLQPVLVYENDILHFSGRRSGMRAFLAVYGGLDTKKWLGSQSTNLKAAVGGMEGRKLRANDQLSSPKKAPDGKGRRHFPWKAEEGPLKITNGPIRFLEGHEWTMLDEKQQQQFLSQEYRVDPRSDRMGYYLQGNSISGMERKEMVSSAVGFGTIQLLPNGMPLILAADHQTMGGYPRMGHVISADHGRLAQTVPGDTINFKKVTMEEAEQSMILQQFYLEQVSHSCRLKLKPYL